MAAEETATAAKAIRVFFIEKFSKVEKKRFGATPLTNLQSWKLLLFNQKRPQIPMTTVNFEGKPTD
jgi:hypothetical protein